MGCWSERWQERRAASLVIASACAEACTVAGRAARAVESAMVAAANLVEVAALVGDTARATMLGALMSGQSLTGGELAFLAHVSRSTASEHLTKLVEARLIAVTRRRRFNYYRIASPLVAQMLESIKVVAAIEMPPRYQPRSLRDDAMRFARTCYDHLAGVAAVAIADALVARDYIVLGDDGGEVTLGRRAFPRRFRCRFVGAVAWPPDFLPAVPGLERTAISHRRSRGRRNLPVLLQRGWFVRDRDSRALRLTPAGAAGLYASFGVDLNGAQPENSAAPSVGKPAKLVTAV